jgi:hypothetical protein
MSATRVKQLHNDEFQILFNFEFRDVNILPTLEDDKTPFAKSCKRTSNPLELIHSYMCGPMSITSRGFS